MNLHDYWNKHDELHAHFNNKQSFYTWFGAHKNKLPVAYHAQDIIKLREKTLYTSQNPKRRTGE